jgi:hypothetical protein
MIGLDASTPNPRLRRWRCILRAFSLRPRRCSKAKMAPSPSMPQQRPLSSHACDATPWLAFTWAMGASGRRAIHGVSAPVRPHYLVAGWKTSMRLPDGSSARIWAPPGPRTISFRNRTPSARSPSPPWHRLGAHGQLAAPRVPSGRRGLERARPTLGHAGARASVRIPSSIGQVASAPGMEKPENDDRQGGRSRSPGNRGRLTQRITVRIVPSRPPFLRGRPPCPRIAEARSPRS